MDKKPLRRRIFFIFGALLFFIIGIFTMPTEAVQKKNKSEKGIGSVIMPLAPKVEYKKFLVISVNHIGFGGGGVKLNGKHYANGTVFEILRETTDTITIDQEGEESTYHKKNFSGRYGTPGTIATVKWDAANKKPTGLDLEGEVFTKYYHFILLLIYKYFWAVAIFLGFTCIVGFLMEESRRAKQWIVLSLSFLIIGACQGNEYHDYLNKFDKINNASGELQISGSMGMNRTAGFFIETSTSYDFGNVVYIPLFLSFHAGFAYVLFLTYIFLYHLFIPHPAEKILLAVQSGKIPRKEAFSKIDAALYDFTAEGIPVKWKSDMWRKRIEALTKRVKAEDDFMKELIQYIKTKSRLE